MNEYFDKYDIDYKGKAMRNRKIKSFKNLMKQEFVKKEGWVLELQMMLDNHKTIDIETVMWKEPEFFTKFFLPKKLSSKDWI